MFTVAQEDEVRRFGVCTFALVSQLSSCSGSIMNVSVRHTSINQYGRSGLIFIVATVAVIVCMILYLCHEKQLKTLHRSNFTAMDAGGLFK